MFRPDGIARREFLQRGLCAAGLGLWPDALRRCWTAARGQDPAPADVLGSRELLRALDGMSHVADDGNDAFAGGHNAAAVMAAVFFSREQQLDAATQQEIRALIDARLLTSGIYAAQPAETADPKLIDSLVAELDAGIRVLRRAGHNIIFASLSLKALRELPEAVTPTRIAGLRSMVRSFGTGEGDVAPAQDRDTLVDLGDEARFVRFVFEEYLHALDLYLHGKGHHGSAGHLLTVGHALLELRRAGHVSTADKGIEAYWQFVRRTRRGADRGGQRIPDGPAGAPTPRDRDYWVARRKRRTGEIVSSHLIKYPYSLFALAKELKDEPLQQRVLDRIHHLTAVS